MLANRCLLLTFCYQGLVKTRAQATPCLRLAGAGKGTRNLSNYYILPVTLFYLKAVKNNRHILLKNHQFRDIKGVGETEDGRRRAENGRQKTEGGGLRTERNPKSEILRASNTMKKT
jgi:hypothetical protein